MVLALIRTYLNIVFNFFVVVVSVQIETAFHNLSLNTVPYCSNIHLFIHDFGMILTG